MIIGPPPKFHGTRDNLRRSARVVGYVRPGARTDEVVTCQLPRVRRRPDVSVLLVDTNDAINLPLLQALARDFGKMLDALADLGAPVVVCRRPEFRAMRARRYRILGVARGYGALVRTEPRRVASRRTHVHLVHVCGAVGREFVRDPSTIGAGSFHPSAAGSARIAAAMTPAVLTDFTPTTRRGTS